jgi:hypothetical protein
MMVNILYAIFYSFTTLVVCVSDVHFIVTLSEHDVLKFGGDMNLTQHLIYTSSACLDCKQKTLLVDTGSEYNNPSKDLQNILDQLITSHVFHDWYLLNHSLSYVQELQRKTGGSINSWPLFSGKPGRRISSLPYFSFLELTSAQYVFHLDADVTLYLDPSDINSKNWVNRAESILKTNNLILAIHPPAWQVDQKVCKIGEKMRCSDGKEYHTFWSKPTLGHGSWISARLFLVDIKRYKSLYGNLNIDCIDNIANISSVTDVKFAKWFSRTHGKSSTNQHWEAYVSCAALIKGLLRADMCGDWGRSWHDQDMMKRPRTKDMMKRCFP